MFVLQKSHSYNVCVLEVIMFVLQYSQFFTPCRSLRMAGDFFSTSSTFRIYKHLPTLKNSWQNSPIDIAQNKKQAVLLKSFVTFCYTTLYKIVFPKTVLLGEKIQNMAVLLNSIITFCCSMICKLHSPQTVLLAVLLKRKKRYCSIPL